MASKIFIKIQHNYTLYNLAHFPRSFEELCFLTLDKFKDLKREGITFSYLDSDAEAICLKSDSDLDVLNEILQETQNKRIKIIVTTKDEPPKEAKKTNEEIGFLNGYFNFLNRIFQRNDVEFDRILSEGRLPCQECLGTRVVGNEPCQHCIGTGVRPYTRKLIHIEKLIENKIRKFVFIPLKEYLGIIDKENIPTPKLKSSGASHSVEEVSKFSSDSNPKERSSLVSGFNKSSVQNQLTQKKTGADLRPKTSGDVYGTNQQYFFKNMDPPSQQEQDHQEINFEDVHQESNNFNFDSDHASTNSKLQKTLTKKIKTAFVVIRAARKVLITIKKKSVRSKEIGSIRRKLQDSLLSTKDANQRRSDVSFEDSSTVGFAAQNKISHSLLDGRLPKYDHSSLTLSRVGKFPNAMKKKAIEFSIKDESTPLILPTKNARFSLEITNKNSFTWPDQLEFEMLNEDKKVIKTINVGGLSPSESRELSFNFDDPALMTNMIVFSSAKLTKEDEGVKYYSKKVRKIIKIQHLEK